MLRVIAERCFASSRSDASHRPTTPGHIQGGTTNVERERLALVNFPIRRVWIPASAGIQTRLILQILMRSQLLPAHE
jgi:hypothetical protein